MLKLSPHLLGKLEKGISAGDGTGLDNPIHVKTFKGKRMSLGKSLTDCLPLFLHLSNKQHTLYAFLFLTIAEKQVKHDRCLNVFR